MSSEVISRSVAPAATGQSSRTASRMKLALDKADGMDILQEHMDRAWLGARPRGRTQPSDIGRVPTEQQEQARGDSYQHFFNRAARSEEHTSELQSLMRISYAVFCLKKKKRIINTSK